MLSRFLLPLLVFLAALMSSATAIAAPADQAEPSELRALLSAGQDTNHDFDASGPTPQRSAVIDEPVAQAQPETPQSFDYSANLKRSEEHTSELQSLMRNAYADYRLKKKTPTTHHTARSTNVSSL